MDDRAVPDVDSCRRGLLAVIAATFAGPLMAAGDGQEDGPQARFEDDLMARLEGDWHLTRKIRGTEEQNTVSVKWVLNHQFLLVHMQDVRQPPRYEALVTIGIIHATGQYVAYWSDIFGGKFSARGIGTRIGNAVEFRFDYDDGPFFNTFTWIPERQQWVCRLENQGANGRRSLFAIDTLERKQ
jgi:hypothetical protein